jgi:hypothetical protein
MRAEIENWNNLPDIDAVTRAAADDAMFAELRQVLARYDALGTYGICLLHKHFDIGADEVLLETSDREGRTLTLRPMPVQALAEAQTVQTIWSMGDGAEAVTKCHMVCYRDEDGFHEKKHWP